MLLCYPSVTPLLSHQVSPIYCDDTVTSSWWLASMIKISYNLAKHYYCLNKQLQQLIKSNFLNGNGYVNVISPSHGINTIAIANFGMPKQKSSSSSTSGSGTKNSGTKKQNDKNTQSAKSEDAKKDEIASLCPIREIKPGQFTIPLAVKPGSKTDGITDISADGISVHISAPPVDGEANSAIIKYFVSLLPIKKTEIELRGGKSRSKTLVVNSPNITSASQIFELLQRAKADQK